MHHPHLQLSPHSCTPRSAILLRKHRQRLECGVYSSNKDGSYLLLPDFILQMEECYDKILSYQPLGTSHQGPIDYMEPRSTRSTTMATPSGRLSTITPDQKPQSPHIIPSDEESLSYKTPLLNSIDIGCLPPPPTKVPSTEPRDENLHKNSVETLSVHTINLVHEDITNIPPIPTLLTPAPCENRTQFKSLNIHRIFGCKQFRNKKHLAAETNASLVN